MKADGNRKCIDCNAACPDWLSLQFGVLICLECAGRHRGMGVHITLVRSLKLDTITEDQLQYLVLGGNDMFTAFCEANVPAHEKGFNEIGYVRYDAPDVLYYRFVFMHIYYLLTYLNFLLYREILLSKIQGREPVSLSVYRDQLVGESHVGSNLNSSSSALPVSTSQSASSPAWVPDDQVNNCMLCNKAFSYLSRRHHCRRCGRCVCGSCAPSDNSRPIHEWGYSEPVRHCRECYKSPAVVAWFQ